MFPFQSVIDRLKSHEVWIFGLGREGLSSYRFIRQHLPSQKLVLIDDLALEKVSPEWADIVAQDSATEFLTSDQADEIPDQALIIKTPGIPLSHPLLEAIKEADIALTTNAQLFFDVLDELKQAHFKITTIGVTGTKGKSTTTALIHHVLADAGKQTWFGGNIGVAPLDLLRDLAQIKADQPLNVVLELSSHQLDDLHTSPNIAIVQNVVPEHLDYYGSFERYTTAKAHITQFQTSRDVVIINPMFEIPLAIAEVSPGQKLGFLTEIGAADSLLSHATTHQVRVIAYRSPEWLIYDSEPIVTVAELPVVGQHNLENVMPSVIVGKLLGLETDTLRQAIRTFKPLPHRLEFVADIEGVSYYNDSLSTVPEATLAALAAFETKPVILLAGGYDRGQDYQELATYIWQKKLKGLIIFPPTGKRLQHELTQLGSTTPIHSVTTMTEALSVVKNMVSAGDVVLLSPASASFGTFKDYQDRGDQFKALVLSQL